jgi:GGDEF domain-containing protein
MVAIFDNCDRPCAEKILKRLEASVHHLAEASEKPYPVHASFGLALSTEKPEADAEKLLSIADQAMYESKKRYKESLGEKAPELR